MNKIKNTDHFYLIDGSGYIFRAYYALPPLSRKSDGMPTGAVSGFCSMLFKLLEDSKSSENKQKPTHFAVIFDSARKNFRNEIYSEYKANRSDAPDDLIPQFEFIRKSVEAFNLPSIELINYEADDLIATYSEQILNEGASILTLSFYGSQKVMPNYNVMGVAKAALETSVKYLSVDLGSNNIRINAISAGPMRTLAGAAIANAREVFKFTQENSSLKRNVMLDEIGNSALYLVSNLSSAVTGEIHYVDCGFNIIGMPKNNLEIS